MHGRLHLVLAASAAIVLAWPAGAGADTGSATDAIVPPERVFAHDSSGFLAALPAGLEGPYDFRVSYVGKDGPEPSVGVDAQGRIFFQAMTRTMRSLDEGATWADVTPPTASKNTLDPLLWVDRWTGRVYNDQLTSNGVSCTWAVYSDFGGDVWNGANILFCPQQQAPTVGIFDHQKMATGPVPPGFLLDSPTPVYEQAVFFGWNSGGVSHMAMSLDGGLTFPFTTITASGTCSGGLHGRIRSLPDGTLLVPKRDCGSPMVASSSTFNAWNRVKVGQDVGSTSHRKNPDIAVDEAGNAYLFWAAADERTWMSYSTDKGLSWSKAVLASPPNVLSSTFHAAVAGEAGKVAVMYYGNDHTAAAPDHVAHTSRWHAYVTFTLDALAADPKWVTVQLDTDADPIQIGPVSTNADGHAPSGSRNLLDFNDLALTPDGRVVAAYADGCTSAPVYNCANNAAATLTSSRDAEGVAAILLAGPRLT